MIFHCASIVSRSPWLIKQSLCNKAKIRVWAQHSKRVQNRHSKHLIHFTPTAPILCRCSCQAEVFASSLKSKSKTRLFICCEDEINCPTLFSLQIILMPEEQVVCCYKKNPKKPNLCCYHFVCKCIHYYLAPRHQTNLSTFMLGKKINKQRCNTMPISIPVLQIQVSGRFLAYN